MSSIGWKQNRIWELTEIYQLKLSHLRNGGDYIKKKKA